MITYEGKPNVLQGCVENALRVRGKDVAYCDRYAKFGAWTWAHAPLPLDDLLTHLAQFHLALFEGRYEPMQRKQFPEGIIVVDTRHVRFHPLSRIGDLATLTKEGFYTVRINTAYGDYVVESNSKRVLIEMVGTGTVSFRHEHLWTPDRGVLAVATHLDLSEPLSKLMSKTIGGQEDAAELESVLREIWSHTPPPAAPQAPGIN